MSLLDLIIRTVSAETLHHFNVKCYSPQKTQDDLLNSILRHNSRSEFGRKYKFDTIGSSADFKKSIPISTYEDLTPYIERSLNGEPAQLTEQSPVLFATTSGTTGKSKFIPVTPASKKLKSKLTRTWVAAIQRDYPTIFSSKILSVVSPEVESYSPCGTPCGAESGHGYKSMSAALRKAYSQPYEVFTIKDYEAKYYTLLRIAAGQTISLMVSCNPSTVLLMAQRLGQNSESIIRDVRDGTLSDHINIKNDIREKIVTHLHPDPDRAKYLEKAAARNSGTLLPRTVWPELQLIGCWKGGSVGLYLDRFDHYFKPGLPVRDMGWLASEVRGSVPLTDSGNDGPLAIGTNYYEFFPADAQGKANGDNLLTIEQLEPGKRYYVYVTTMAGLYRYDMNDILEVTSMYHNTPVIRFVQKGKGVVSFTGEKLYEEQVIIAVNQVLDSRGYQGQYEFITAIGEIIGDTPRYTFLIEFENTVDKEQGRELIDDIEKSLRIQNMEYATKRDSHRIAAPALRVIQPGQFDSYRKRQVNEGKLDGQFKVMRLTKNKALADEFEVAFQLEL